jgi:uncharacterized membrane protein
MDESINSTYTVTSKKRVLLALVALYVLHPPVLWLASSSEAAYGGVSILFAIAILTACIIWVHIDAREKGVRIGSGFRVFMVLFLPVALTYYFYKSRGLRAGTWTLLKAVGFFLGLVVLMIVEEIVLSLIYGRFSAP